MNSLTGNETTAQFLAITQPKPQPQDKPYSVNLRALERYGDPRECQIDLDAPLVYIHDKCPQGIRGQRSIDVNENRVMPLLDVAKFHQAIRRQTSLCVGVNDSHFWVSGYYAIHFASRSPIDRKKMKQIVQAAAKEIGFMPFEAWYKAHCGGAGESRFVIATGTGSNIRVSGLSSGIAFR